MITDIIAGVLSGMVGAMGFGGGGILILYLTLYKNLPQLTSQGINLIFFIPSSILALILHSKNKLIEWKLAFKLIPFGFLGLIAGYFAINYVDENIIRKIFSGILIYMGISGILRKNEE